MILHKVNKAKAPCGTHGSDAVKVFPFSDFDFAGLFSSAFLFSTKKVDLSARSCSNKFDRDARLMINFLPGVILDQASAREGIHTFASRVILGAKRRGSRGAFILEFN
jgi:hypothetical protein